MIGLDGGLHDGPDNALNEGSALNSSNCFQNEHSRSAQLGRIGVNEDAWHTRGRLISVPVCASAEQGSR
jgi:hypothetical protein